MSLYNALFGVNPFANALLMSLGTSANAIPRFRDCFFDEEGRIVIYTRTGGGNRLAYECEEECRNNFPEFFAGEERGGPYNADIREIDGFLFDQDDDFDSTYARFYFAPKPELADILAEIREKQGKRDPSEAFQQLLADLTSRTETAETKRARAVGERIFGAIRDGNTDSEV